MQRALITGASVAGLTTAFWLARAGWEVEVVERSPSFRDGGQNVDVRGAAHEVIALMGLTQKIHDLNTTEAGTAFLGAGGRVLGRVPVENDQDGPTAELEILRGDLARVILEALPSGGGVAVRYDDQVSSAAATGQHLKVEFASGKSGVYDLFVIAEDVRSRTREFVFGSLVEHRELGLTMVYGTIPRTRSDDDWWRWYTATKRRGITLRPDNVGTIRATLAYIDRGRGLGTVPIEEAKRSLTQTFRGAGWEADRVTSALLDSADVYVDDLAQIVTRSWSQGRIALTGDAAWCVTPLGGGGTSLALIGGYVLSAFVSRSSGDVAAALQEYEQWMRPPIDSAQDLPRGMPDAFYPNSRARVALSRGLQWILTTKPFTSILVRRSHVASTDQDLPRFSE